MVSIIAPQESVVYFYLINCVAHKPFRQRAGRFTNFFWGDILCPVNLKEKFFWSRAKFSCFDLSVAISFDSNGLLNEAKIFAIIHLFGPAEWSENNDWHYCRNEAKKPSSSPLSLFLPGERADNDQCSKPQKPHSSQGHVMIQNQHIAV